MGPVVAAAVVLPAAQPASFPAHHAPFVRDSKTVSEKRRGELAIALRAHAHAYGVGEASVAEIDSTN